MLGAFAFLIGLVIPISIFALVALRVKHWPFRRLKPYVVGYFALVGGLLSLGFRLHGWDWVVGVAISMAVAWLGMTSWIFAIEHSGRSGKT